jgi:hypothetical protein
MQLIKHSKNLHEIIVPTDDFQIAMLSDIHWDNPKCDWDVLKSHLDYFKKNNIPVMVNGDFFVETSLTLDLSTITLDTSTQLLRPL